LSTQRDAQPLENSRHAGPEPFGSVVLARTRLIQASGAARGNVPDRVIFAEWRSLRASNFPIRTYFIDTRRKPCYLSRTVKIMARRQITTAEVGDIVRTTRKAAGLRQDELAGAAGVGLRFIVDLEAGKPTAQIGKTLQVLAALGCSVDITPPPESKGAGTA